MTTFRPVDLGTPGTLFLHSMPGRLEEFSQCVAAMQAAKLSAIICLNPMEEVMGMSPDYAKAIADESLPIDFIHFPIRNYGVPEDRAAFLALAQETADKLKQGGNLLVHCAGGIGRTGTFASCVAASLGQPLSRVADAGGKPETVQQRELIASL